MAAQIFPCQTVGWPLSADARGEESPGSTEVRCRVTPGGGDPRESATESTPPACLRLAGRAARVKWCGKSAPRRRQRRRQGKPHREQDQIGAAGTPEQSDMPGEPPRRRSGRSQEALGDERPRGMAITAPGGYARGGTEPGLYAVWRPVPVDALADQTGISNVSGGQPCGRPNSLLHIKLDRVASLIVWSTRGVRGCDPEIRSEAGVREPLRHTQGEGAGDPIGSPVPFLAFDLSATIGGIMADDANPLNSELITLSVNVQMVEHLDRISMGLPSTAAPVAL